MTLPQVAGLMWGVDDEGGVKGFRRQREWRAGEKNGALRRAPQRREDQANSLAIFVATSIILPIAAVAAIRPVSSRTASRS